MPFPVVSLVGRDEWLLHCTTCPEPRPKGGPALLGSKSQIHLQPADLVWLQGWSEFVNFVRVEYPDLTKKRMGFNSRSFNKIYFIKGKIYLMHIYTFCSLRTKDNSEDISIYYIWFPISFCLLVSIQYNQDI